MMRTLRDLTSLFLLSTLIGCAGFGPGAWRAGTHGPSTPAPTLLGAVVFDMKSGEGLGGNPLAAASAITGRIRGEKTIAAAAPRLAEHAATYLQQQGFPLERDAARANKLVGLPPARTFDPVWVDPECSERTFHDLAVFGGVGPVLEAVKTSRERECYASVYAEFAGYGNGNDFTEGGTCMVILTVLDQDGNTVFKAQGSGSAQSSGDSLGEFLSRPYTDLKTGIDQKEAAVVEASFANAMRTIARFEIGEF